MSKNSIVAIAMSLVVGSGLGFAIGRNAEPFKVGSQPITHNANGNKMTSELGSKDEEFDLRFINEMIAHHEGAIDMAKQAQLNSDRPEIINLASEIIIAQSKEIDQMNQWKESWYGN
ncbi:MAG: DUF305 domain-containing protein [bacterium]|nr:DUF305 domain-containing protein [bacterium]